MSYSMPQGVRRGPELDLSDRTYDGREEGGQLTHGLGQLVDGQKGQDNFRLDLTGNGKGKVRPLRRRILSSSFTFILHSGPTCHSLFSFLSVYVCVLSPSCSHRATFVRPDDFKGNGHTLDLL